MLVAHAIDTRRRRMSEIPRVGAFAIVPSNNLPAAIPFWERLGFARTGGVDFQACSIDHSDISPL
jgi:hypothetical protein